MEKGLAIVVATLMCLCTLMAVIGAETDRIRLTERTGVIVEPASGTGNYADRRNSLWFIEGNNSSTMGYVKLKFDYLDLECSWDYLYIFGSDSVHGDKLAAYSGNVLPPTNVPQQGRPTAISLDGHLSSLTDNNDSSSISGSGSGDMSEFLPTREILLSAPAPHLLLHFYSDAGANARGFNLSYWVSSCIANCSENGDCNEEIGVCDCYTGWTGDHCQHVECPSDCSDHGVCDRQQKLCVCDNGFAGKDCSIPRNTDHWQRVDASSSLGIDDIERAGHTAVVWDEWMWVYGGYQFPTVSSSSQDGSGDGSTPTQMIRYHFESETWEPVLHDDAVQPSPRYGHSAVVYNDTMVVFGGSLLPAEHVTNELWMFNFSNLSWVQIPTEASLNKNTSTTSSSFLPIGVRDHTANTVGDKMIVLFGYSELRDTILTYVQEYSFVDKTWSAPLSSFNSYSVFPTSRMGHTSNYIAETGLIYVYGGYNTEGAATRHTLLTYHPSSHVWSDWAPSPLLQTFHATATLGSLLVSFGGTTSTSCIGNNTAVYNIVCDSWQIVDFPGLTLNSSRIGHTAVRTPYGGGMIMFGGFLGQLHHDTLHLIPGNCSRLSAAQCAGNASPFCAWSNSTSQCVSLHSQYHLDNTICSVPDPCRMLFTCSSCLSSTLNCVWNRSNSQCLSSSLAGSLTNSTHITSNSSDCAATLLRQTCSSFHSCNSCAIHDECLWNNVLIRCIDAGNLQSNNTFPVTPPGLCPVSGCFQHTSCSSCSTINSCLWCPSLNVCVSSLYPYVFPFGQCLGWFQDRSCPADDCSGYSSCDSCEGDVRCGWCQGLANTGLGVCREGGYLAPQNTSACPASRWFFDECPACQCNGHSVCVNESICVDCLNNTKGAHCEQCVDTFYGDPRNGQFCSVCDCNGYNTTCNNTNGNCVCSNVGVSGSRCTQCFTQQGFNGDASNICYYTLQVGYIYSQLTTGNGQEAFYLTKPSGDAGLTFRFEITFNPELNPIWVQLYLGRASERYQVLVNLTEPRMLEETGSFDMTIDDFSSPNDTELFTFAHEDIMNTSNFTELFNNAAANDYTSSLWDGDVALIIRVFNVSSPVVYKITVDQSNLMFLLYFFVTFVSCFTFLLSAFLIGWYIKRKLEIRAFIRAQHIEMQRRVRRPFARIKTIVEKRLEPRMRQQASYVAVETCKDTKAAVLTLLVRLPGNRETGYPSSGRTGVCFGSTIVKMNSSKIKNKKNKESSSAPRRRNHTEEVHIDT